MAGNPLNLDEPAEWVGQWWLPYDPDTQVSGTLQYDGGGNIVLKMTGGCEALITSENLSGLMYLFAPVIHGVVSQRKVTLLGCMDNHDRQTVRANTAIIGAHVSGEEDAAFEAAEISVEHLSFWAASSVFEDCIDTSEDKTGGSRTSSVKPIETRVAKYDGTEYRLMHTRNLPFSDCHDGGTVERTHDTVSIRICCAEPFTLRAALEEASLVQDLIALATHSAAGVIWLRLEVAGTGPACPNGQPSLQCADVLYSPAVLGKHDAKPVDPYRVFFTCKQLPFEEVMPRWCKIYYDQLKAATKMILGLRYVPPYYVEINLLMAVSAAEALHRGLGIGKKPFSKTRLKYRLRDLATRLDKRAIKLLVPDIDYWAERTAQARNSLAHEASTPEHSFGELVAIVETTTAVVILNILHELGLPESQQHRIMQEHPQLYEVSQKARMRLVDSKSHT